MTVTEITIREGSAVHRLGALALDGCVRVAAYDGHIEVAYTDKAGIRHALRSIDTEDAARQLLWAAQAREADANKIAVIPGAQSLLRLASHAAGGVIYLNRRGAQIEVSYYDGDGRKHSLWGASGMSVAAIAERMLESAERSA